MLMNWGMDAVGLGDYAPGTLMQDGIDWVADGGIGRTAGAIGDGISDAASWWATLRPMPPHGWATLRLALAAESLTLVRCLGAVTSW